MAEPTPELHLHESVATDEPERRRPPTFPSLSFTYAPAADRDTNLLILFHGLGDTRAPFSSLAKSLNLPQTATLSLQGPQRVPLLEEEAYQWWPSFDELGELIANPNPTPTLTTLTAFLTYLTSSTPAGLGWPPSSIHFFGFAQGGSCAAQLALAWSLLPPAASRSASHDLGTLVTISAPLLSHPTVTYKSQTKTLVVLRKGEERSVGVGSYRKGFENVQEVTLARGEGMPRGRQEWEEIMRFWAANLGNRSAIEFEKGVYEVRGGMGAAQAANTNSKR
ncbi:hypothetical protein P7C70_g7594, partial [Phenoliferia sp. Uapishka_3]